MPDDYSIGLAPDAAAVAAPTFASQVRPTLPQMKPAPAASAADADLLAAVANRDDRALATLYDRHGRTAYALAHRLLGEDHAAEEVVRDAFLAVWGGTATVHAVGDVRLWLLGQVRRRAIDRLRGENGLHDTPHDAVAAVTPSGDLRWATDATSRAEALRRALDMLPDAQSRVLRLAYFGGLTCRELAARDRVPVAIIRDHLRLGLATLRDALAAP
jgi:RNA polymerase sigma-70 factor (ECF subfamily)